jgi:hypothetical protein
MRRIIGAIGLTLAVVAVMATSAATANAQTAIEYALMSGFVASGQPMTAHLRRRRPAGHPERRR